MLSLEREKTAFHRHTCLEHDSSSPSNFCDLWSAQRNLLNSFINFLPDWKINYHFLCVGNVVACLLYRSTARSTAGWNITQHTQTSPFMVPEWPTRFLTFFHSHFLQFLSFAVLFLRLARDSFIKVGVTCRVSLTPQSCKFEVKVCTFKTRINSFEVKVKLRLGSTLVSNFAASLTAACLVYSRKFEESSKQLIFKKIAFKEIENFGVFRQRLSLQKKTRQKFFSQEISPQRENE